MKLDFSDNYPMKSKSNSAWIVIAIGLISGAAGLMGNIAASSLPDVVKPYLWLAWPLFLILIALGIILSVIQSRRPDELGTLSKLKEPYMSSIPNNNSESLRQQLTERTSLSDLKGFCFTMEIDDEDFPTGKNDFIRELLKQLTDRGRLDEFVNVLRRDAPWVLR